MKKVQFLLVGLLSLMVLSAPLLASEGKKFDKRMNLDQLNLTPEQKDQVKKIHEENKSAIEDTQKAIHEVREEMTKAMEEGASDEKLRKLHKKISKMRSELTGIRFDSMLAVRGILTDEQKKKFRYMHEEMKNNPEHKMMGKGKPEGMKPEAKPSAPDISDGY